ncbi:hypothetical protein A0257_18375 [Hymenobacter psoromatis]|nr:hypothetical protein A0257_18375 [Hymenobacter psoromatis]
MKKYVLLTLGLTALAAASGCKKDILNENPTSILTPSFLGTPQGVEAGLTGTYSGFRYIFGSDLYLFMTSTGVDEFMRGIATIDGLDEYNPSLLTPSNAGAVAGVWNNLYRYINDANGVLQYAATVQGIAPARVTQIVAETKLLRAQYYFVLVQQWGDVPLMITFVDSPTKDLTRAPVADVYTQIIKDLTDALATIADKPAQPGRVTRATALHLLAKVYLTRATSTAKQAGDYASAAQYAKELIDNQGRYGVALEADPARVHAEGNENGPEVLFNVQFNGDATFSQTDPNNFTANNASLFLFRSRYDLLPNMSRDIKNGRPFARFCPTPYVLNTFVLPGESGASLRTTDTRYNKWWTTVYYVNTPGNNGGSTKAVVGDTATWYPGRELTAAQLARIATRLPAPYKVITPSQYTTEYFPTMNKYDAVNRTGVNNPSPRPFIVYRLAETYLIAAEAYFYLGNSAQAATYLNVVRERAAAPGKKAQMDITAGQVSLDFLLDERTRELAGENTRWPDLVRTGQLLARVKADVPPIMSRTNPSGTYGSAAAANIKPFHVLRPIPQPEVDRTLGQPGGGIKQNPGY